MIELLSKFGSRGMRTTFSNDLSNVLMIEERRKHNRYKIECPVRALTPGRGKKKVLGRGTLYDINENGARFTLDHALDEGKRMSLEVDFRNPDDQVTTIRFPAIVKRVNGANQYEIAVSFLKGESFIRGKRTSTKAEDSQWYQFTQGSRWIN
jgi:PilZ domain